MGEAADNRIGTKMALAVFGARGTITSVTETVNRVEEVSSDVGAEVQLLDASKVLGREHIEVAVERALRAFDEGRNFAHSLPVEVLLYASGRRQISEAMALMGLHEGDMEIAVVALAPAGPPVPDDLPERLGLRRDDGVLERTPEEGLLEAFGISREARAGVPRDRWVDLVLERIALLDVEK